MLELSLLDYAMVVERPSKMAAAAFLWAMAYLKKGEWNDSMEYHTSYTVPELTDLVVRMAEIVLDVLRNKRNNSIFQKYAEESFFKVSLFMTVQNLTQILRLYSIEK